MSITKSKRKPRSKAKIAAAARLQKARRINLPEFRDRIQSYLEDDIDDSAEPIRCHDLQHFIRNFKAAPNVIESSYRECRVCANDMIVRALKARDSDLAVINSWGGKLRMSITSTDKEYRALKRKINHHKVPYFFIHGEGHRVVISHPDSDIGGVLHDTYESSVEVLNMVYALLADLTVGDSGLTTSGRKYGACSGNVAPIGTTGTPPTGATPNTPPIDIDPTETPSVETSDTSNTPSIPQVPPKPASMNPDDWTDGGDSCPDPVEMTEEELYTSRMHEHDTPYSKLPRDVRRALSCKDMTKFRKAPKGYMELARTHHAEHFIVRGKQLTWIPLKYWEEFKKKLADPNRQVAYA